MTRLGRIQKAALTLMAGRAEGCCSADLAGVAARNRAGDALRSLGDRGLARQAGTRPAASADGGGRPLQMWVITEQGRKRLAGRSS